MSLTKAPKRQQMREFYLRAPTKNSTTAYICRQVYDREQKRTIQTLVASFNVATDPAAPVVNITEKGRAQGYNLPAKHLAEVQSWLKKHGTFGKVSVPARVLARVRAEVEAQVRAELNAGRVERPRPAPNPTLLPAPVPALAPETETAEDRLVRLLRTIEAACVEVEALMPESAKQFRRGFEFRDETVRQVRRVWFKCADAISAMNGRQQLKRPKNWEPLRREVFRGSYNERGSMASTGCNCDAAE